MNEYPFEDVLMAVLSFIIMSLNVWQIISEWKVKNKTIGKLQYVTRRSAASSLLFYTIGFIIPYNELGITVCRMFFGITYGIGYSFFLYIVYQMVLNTAIVVPISPTFIKFLPIMYALLWVLYWISFACAWFLIIYLDRLRYFLILLIGSCLILLINTVLGIVIFLILHKHVSDIESAVFPGLGVAVNSIETTNSNKSLLADFWKFVSIVGLCSVVAIGVQLYQCYVFYVQNASYQSFLSTKFSFYAPIVILLSSAATYYGWISVQEDGNAVALSPSNIRRLSRIPSFGTVKSGGISPSVITRIKADDINHTPSTNADANNAIIESGLTPSCLNSPNPDNPLFPENENPKNANHSILDLDIVTTERSTIHQ